MSNELVAVGPNTVIVQEAVRIVVPWRQGGWPENIQWRPQTIACLEVESVGADSDSSDSGAAGRQMRLVAERALSAAMGTNGLAALELRYITEPKPDGPNRTRMFVLARADGVGQTAKAITQNALVAFELGLPTWFRWRVVPKPLDVLTRLSEQPICELRRGEQVTFPQWDFVPADFYYHIADTPGDGTGWASFWGAFGSSPVPVAASFLFKPAGLTAIERDSLGGITSDLAVLARPRTEYNLIGWETEYPADENARIVLEAWQRYLLQLERQPMMVRIALQGDLEATLPLAGTLSSGLAQTADPARPIHPMSYEVPTDRGDLAIAVECFESMEVFPWGGDPIWERPNRPNSLRRLPYLFGAAEAGALALLPTGDKNGVPGFPKSRFDTSRRLTVRDYSETGPGVVIGQFLHLGRSAAEATLPLTALNRHALTVGAPGSGKTTTVMTVLGSLWRDHRIPWCVIELTRPEYRSMMRVPDLDELLIFSLGRDDLSPLRLNPLEPPTGVRCESHASALMASFRLAIPMDAPLPELLQRAIERTYLMSGWDFDTKIEDGIPAPSLRDLLACYEQVCNEANYEGQARNVLPAFTVRLQALMSGGRGRMLDTITSSDWDNILAKPTVFELRDLDNDEDKALFAALILQRIRAAALNRGAAKKLEHLTVIDEAHRILPEKPSTSLTGEASSRVGAIEQFVNAIAELRSLGEGFLIASQSPARLSQAAVDNTSTRIIHALASDEDRSDMLRDMHAGEEDARIAGQLQDGECLIRWPGLDEPMLVKVIPGQGVDTRSVPSDGAVADWMQEPRQAARYLLPYPLCTSDICIDGCNPARRAGGAGTALRLRPHVQSKEFVADQSMRDLTNSVTNAVASLHQASDAMAYCTLVHVLLEKSPIPLALSRDDVPRFREGLWFALRQARNGSR